MSSPTSLVLASLAGLILIGQFSHQQDVYDNSPKSFKFASSSLIVIEDQPSGLYAATSDNNYAIISLKLTHFGWSSLSVNDNQIFVVKSNNFTFEKSLDELGEDARDFLSEKRGHFQQNLAGLEFTSTSGQLISALMPSVNYPGYSSEEQSQLYDVNQQQQQQQQAPDLSLSSNYESRSLNYYQLSNSRLNKTLDGDVYQMDLSTNKVLDVYSSSVSVREVQDRSILYRDHRYFSYGKPNMPLAIKRIFLFGNYVILIYNDNSILAKLSWMLDAIELDLIVQLRAELKGICNKLQVNQI